MLSNTYILLQCESDNHWPEWGDDDGTDEVKLVDLPEYAYAGQEQEIIIGGEKAFV